jgi:NADH-quinone oxidoreductase subunit L
MVAAGVFLVARVWPLFEASPGVLQLILVIGVFTAVMAATAATAQTDIKRVLAYSTISQLGFMFAALGLGAWEIAMFHLATHAAFKALLFLGSGSVIHGSGTQDMREMGGLFRKMPVTGVTWIVGAAALAGLPGLAGFFSKDEILAAAYHDQLWVVVVLWAASLFTAFYITRATMLTFFGKPRGDSHAHESGATMLIPLMVLAVLAATEGYFASVIAELLGEEAHALEPTVAGISATVAVAGVVAAVVYYRRALQEDARLATALGPVWRAWEHAYWFDDFVQRVVVRPTVVIASVLYDVVDRLVIDGIVEGAGTASRWVGRGMNAVQSGDVQWYGALIGGGVIALLALSYLIVMQDQLADTFANLGLW